MDPRLGRHDGGAIEVALLSVATIEMGRFCGLPVEAARMGSTDPQILSIQIAFKGSVNNLLPTMPWPDVLVGPGMLGAMTLGLVQLLVVLEVFRMCRQARRWIAAVAGDWLEGIVDSVGPARTYIGERPTEMCGGGEWYITRLRVHDTFEDWSAAGRPKLLTVLPKVHC